MRKHNISRAWTIYALAEPDGTIRYIGKCGPDTARRRREHVARAMAGERTPRAAWIRALASTGQKPRVMTLRRGQGAGHAEAERDMIAMHRPDGRLLNMTDGGHGVPGWERSPEWRQAHREACGRANAALARSPEWQARKKAGEAAYWARRASVPRERKGSGGPSAEFGLAHVPSGGCVW